MPDQRRSETKQVLSAIVATYLLASLSGVVAIQLQDGFGDSDLGAYFFLCLPFAGLTGYAACLFSESMRRFPTWIATSLTLPIGAICGFVATYVTAIPFGAWFGAMSVPILPLWIATATTTFFTVALIGRCGAKTWTIAAALLLALFAFGGAENGLALIAKNQHLEIEFFEYRGGDGELEIVDMFPGEKMATSDLELLKKSGLRGVLKWHGSTSMSSTSWPKAKAIFVVSFPVEITTTLPQPDANTIIYFLGGTTARRFPSKTPVLDRSFRTAANAEGVSIEVEHFDGAVSTTGSTFD